LNALEIIGTKVCDEKKIINLPKSEPTLINVDSEIGIQEKQFLDTNFRINTSINKGTYKEVDNCEDNETLVIEKTSHMDIEIQDNILEDRRIVDLSFLIKEMYRTFDDYAEGIDCSFKDWRVESTKQ